MLLGIVKGVRRVVSFAPFLSDSSSKKGHDGVGLFFKLPHALTCSCWGVGVEMSRSKK